MRFKKIITILIVVFVLFLLCATFLSLSSNRDSIVGNDKGNVSIAVTGDVMFAREMASVLSLDSSPFSGVSNVTSNVDLLLINFENAATTSENAVKDDVPLKCDPKYVPLAKANNNTVAALANNHVFDYGANGMRDTVNSLKGAGITTIGVGENEAEAHAAVTQEINGRKITILNYMDSNNFAEYSHDVIPPANASSPGYSAYDSADAQKQISEAKKNGSDMVIVFMHYGNEYSTSPNDDQIKISHEVIDDGADIVIGSHPHVTQGIEMYKGKPVFYSEGDFIFDLVADNTLDAYFVKIDLVGDTAECTVYPVHLTNYLPQFMSTKDGNDLLNGLSPKCSQLKVEDGVGKLKFNLTENKSN